MNLSTTNREMASLVAPASARGSAPDTDDDMVIGTAIAAHADLLVTGDRALLELGDLANCRIVSVSGAIRLITEAEALYPPAPGM